MTTQPTARSTNRSTLMTRLGFATLIVAILTGSLLIALRTPAPTIAPTAPLTVPAAPATLPSSSNRYFADEIAGANAQDLSIAASSAQSEWQSAPAAPVFAPAAPASSTGNHIFNDEIAAGAGVADWSAPEAPVVLPQHGPR